MAASAQRGRPRKRLLIEKVAFPKVEEIKKKLKAAMEMPASMEKVLELSRLALAFNRATAVADSYNAFAYAVRAARFLPAPQQEYALRLVRSDFRKTSMDISCFEGL